MIIDQPIGKSRLMDTLFLYLIMILPYFTILEWFFAKNHLVHRIGLFLGGWFSWTYLEYVIHRFGYHERGVKQIIGLRLLHQYHHTHPNEIKVKAFHRLFLIGFSACFFVFSLWKADIYFLFAGLFTGISIYFLMHYFLHQPISAKIFPILHRNHIHHHCQSPECCHGISVSWWDQLLGTTAKEDRPVRTKTLAFYYTGKNGEPKRT
jgi:sterol desaturase/sphingolipid hydroxylase (fatty acid hydroxylase superfamily)